MIVSYLKRIHKKLLAYGKLVMFSHTIFSFSFAVIALLEASGGRPRLSVVWWALAALLGARTGANALNRAIDAKIDAKNPRTADRQIPRGEISTRETLLLTGVCFAVLVAAAWQLNPLCFALSPLALFLMTVYSYTKRFTWTCHLVLGITCACAPVGAWLAVTGHFSWEALLLGAANCLWTAGFDVIYGCQDYEFDRQNGLYSIPVRFGIAGALTISTLLHIGAFASLCVYGWMRCGVLFALGLVVTSVLMLVQHRMVSPARLEHVRIACYSVSQLTSLSLLIFGVLDIAFRYYTI